MKLAQISSSSAYFLIYARRNSFSIRQKFLLSLYFQLFFRLPFQWKRELRLGFCFTSVWKRPFSFTSSLSLPCSWIDDNFSYLLEPKSIQFSRTVSGKNKVSSSWNWLKNVLMGGGYMRRSSSCFTCIWDCSSCSLHSSQHLRMEAICCSSYAIFSCCELIFLTSYSYLPSIFSLISTTFFTLFSRQRKSRVDTVYETHAFWEEIMPMKVVTELPPMLSLSSFVSTDQRYGMCDALLCFSVSLLITKLKVVSDLLMLLAYFSLLPDTSVCFCFSEPARSTKFSLESLTRHPFSSSTIFTYKKTVRIVWEREETSFILVDLVDLFSNPRFSSLAKLSSSLISTDSSPSTQNPDLANYRMVILVSLSASKSRMASLQIYRQLILSEKQSNRGLFLSLRMRRATLRCTNPSFDPFPVIVYVFPVPVCPQANSVLLRPFSVFSTSSKPMCSKISSSVASGEKT